MPWELRYDEELKIVETVYSGRITPEDLEAAVQATLRLAKERGTNRYLGDCTAMEAGAPVLNVYELPKYYEDVFVDRRSKHAMVLPFSKEAEADIKFYETVCRNRGYSVRVFRERGKAVAWLTE